jgi:hypothetical protein
MKPCPESSTSWRWTAEANADANYARANAAEERLAAVEGEAPSATGDDRAYAEAVEAAQSLLDYGGLPEDLFEMLVSPGGFTPEQAEYAVSQVY